MGETAKKKRSDDSESGDDDRPRRRLRRGSGQCKSTYHHPGYLQSWLMADDA